MTIQRSLLALAALGMLGLCACGGPQTDTPVKEKDVVAKAPAPTAPTTAPTRSDGKTQEEQVEAVEAELEEPQDEYSAYDPRVARAARVAVDIEADPAKADAILAAMDLDREKLDSLMFEIAGNPELSKQYRIARGVAPQPADADKAAPTAEEEAPHEAPPADAEAPH